MRCRNRLTDAPTINILITLLEGRYFESLAKDVFCNQQRTSTRNGILKSEAVYRFAKTLQDYGITTFGDTADDQRNEQVRTKIQEIKGQKSGISFDYFLMLAGSDRYVKADRMLRAFVADALRESNVSADNTRALVLAACARLQAETPHLTPRLLDHEIWKYQREMQKSKQKVARTEETTP